MNPINPIIWIGISLVLTACTKDSVDLDAEKERLMQLSRDWSEIVNSGDIDAVIAHWDDDSVLLPPDSPIIEGKDEIRAYVESTSSIPGFRISWEPERAHVSKAGDMAYLIERNEISFNDDTGQPVIARGKVVTVWRKNNSGEWKNVVEIWNSVPGDAQ